MCVAFCILCKWFFLPSVATVLLFFALSFFSSVDIVSKFTGYLSFALLFFKSLNFPFFPSTYLELVWFRFGFFSLSLNSGIFLFVLSCWRYKVCWCSTYMCVFGILFTCKLTHSHTHILLTRNGKAYCRISPKIQLPIFFRLFFCLSCFASAIAATATRVSYSGHTMPCSTKCTYTHWHMQQNEYYVFVCATRISVLYLFIFRFLVDFVVFLPYCA